MAHIIQRMNELGSQYWQANGNPRYVFEYTSGQGVLSEGLDMVEYAFRAATAEENFLTEHVDNAFDSENYIDNNTSTGVNDGLEESGERSTKLRSCC